MTSTTSSGKPAIAVVIDIAIVAFFAAFGRVSHGLHLDLASFFEVAWPFLVALAVSWIVALVWRAPDAPLRSGLPVAVGTLAIGMLLRYFVAEDGASWPFIGVAGGLFLVLFIGWRGIATLIRRRRSA